MDPSSMFPSHEFVVPPMRDEHRGLHEQLESGQRAVLIGLDDLPPSTGWKLVLGYDALGNAVEAFSGVLTPPNAFRRLMRRLLLGERWEQIKPNVK